MSPASIIAFIAFLSAFGVDQPTIDKIHDILVPVSVTVVSQPAVTPPPILGTQSPAPDNTAPVVQSAPVPPEQFIVKSVELSPGGYFRVWTNKPFTVQISSGSLAAPLVDNYPADFLQSLAFTKDGTTYDMHVYEYKMLEVSRPFTYTLTDADSQTYKGAFN